MTPQDTHADPRADIRKALEAGPTSAYYTHPRDDNKWRENEAFALACTPEAITALLAAADRADALLSLFDAAVAAELPRVSHLEYDSHEICKQFAATLRERLAAMSEQKEPTA